VEVELVDVPLGLLDALRAEQLTPEIF
jgi:hypothetical protein